MRSFTLSAVIVVLSLSLLVNSSRSQPVITGRSAGLAGAGVLTAPGAQSIGWNPALLGLRAAPRFSCLLPSLGLMMGNNSVSPHYMEDMFVTGRHLEAADKSDILDQLAGDELRVFGGYSVPMLGASFGSYSLNFFDARMAASGQIPKEIVYLFFTGGDSAKIYRLDDVAAQSLLYWSSSFSFAHDLPPLPSFSELALGVTVRYLHGMSYDGLEKTNGWFQIIGDTIHAVGGFKYLNAGKGDGVGLDLGVAGWLESQEAFVGLTLGNLLGDIHWNDVQMEEMSFERHSGVALDSVSYDNYWKHFFHDRDTTYSADTRTTSLPVYMILALSKPHCWLKGRADINVAWYQGLTKEQSGSLTPRLSVGSEILTRHWLIVRLGMGIGGQEGFTLAGGMGLKFARYQLDIGGSWQRGVISSAKGVSLAVTNYLSIDR